MARKKNANLFTNRSCLGNDLNFHGNDCLHNLKYQPIVRSSTQKQPFRLTRRRNLPLRYQNMQKARLANCCAAKNKTLPTALSAC